MGMKFSLADLEPANSLMIEYVDEIKEQINSIFQEFHVCVVEQNQYKPAYDIAENLERIYNEEIVQKIKEEIQGWAEDEGCYVGIVKNWSAGEDAEAEAQRQQETIVEHIQEIQEIAVISESRPDFSASNWERDTLKEKFEEISGSAQTLNEIVDRYDGQFRSMSEENAFVEALVSVGQMYGKSISSFVEEATKRISEFMSEKMDSLTQSHTTKQEELQQKTEQLIQSIDDSVSQISALAAELFDF